MSIIVRLKRLIKKCKGKYQVWDTSAVSTWLDKLHIQVNNGVNIIIPEGVTHELSVGRRNHENCRKAYNYVKEGRARNLRVHVTSDKMRSWAVDEQIVAITYEYFKAGYDVVLVTCDHDQAYKARLRGLEVQLLAGSRAQTKFVEVPKKENNPTTVEQKEILTLDDELVIPCITKGKDHYINVKHKISVYSQKGKRQFGRENLIPVKVTDVCEYMGYKYNIQRITDTNITLKKIKY